MSTNNCCENMNPANCEEKKGCSTIIKQYYGCGCCDNSNDSAGRNNNGHSPYIGENGNWFEWSVDANDFIDTEVRAEGLQGEIGPQGPQGVAEASLNMDLIFDGDAKTHENSYTLTTPITNFKALIIKSDMDADGYTGAFAKYHFIPVSLINYGRLKDIVLYDYIDPAKYAWLSIYFNDQTTFTVDMSKTNEYSRVGVTKIMGVY